MLLNLSNEGRSDMYDSMLRLGRCHVHLPRTGVTSFYLCSALTDAKFTRRKAESLSERKKWDIKQTWFL